MKLEFSRQILEKYSNVKFYVNPSSGSRVVPCGLTEGGSSRLSQFCERRLKKKSDTALSCKALSGKLAANPKTPTERYILHETLCNRNDILLINP